MSSRILNIYQVKNRGGGCVNLNKYGMSNMVYKHGSSLGLENLEKWEGIFKSGKSQEFLSRLEKSGDFAQSTG